jgi:hypothetical protein
MIKIKYVEIHAGASDNSIVSLKLGINEVIHESEFSDAIKRLNNEFKIKYPDRHINYVLYSSDEISEAPEGFNLVERKK